MPEPSRFESLVLPHLGAGYNLARWLTRNAHDAEDVTQEACMRALRYVGSMRDGEARAWFLTLVRHACYDWLERNRGPSVTEPAAESAAGADWEPAHRAARRGEAQALEHALAELPWPYREVIVLRELEDLSYREIAAVADIPIGTVMSRLARARALLRRSPALHAVAAHRTGAET